MNEAIRGALLACVDEDRRVRARLAADGSLFEGYHPEMQAVHTRNAAVLARIIDAHGWPGRPLVGEDGAVAAWLIVQHDIGEPAFVRRCFALLEAAVSAGEAPAAHAAYLEDRIRVYEGRPQRYGTQYDWDDAGGMVAAPVEEPDRIDERRERVGLPPFVPRRPPPADEPRPGDLPGRRARAEAWQRAVGWRA